MPRLAQRVRGARDITGLAAEGTARLASAASTARGLRRLVVRLGALGADGAAPPQETTAPATSRSATARKQSLVMSLEIFDRPAAALRLTRGPVGPRTARHDGSCTRGGPARLALTGHLDRGRSRSSRAGLQVLGASSWYRRRDLYISASGRLALTCLVRASTWEAGRGGRGSSADAGGCVGRDGRLLRDFGEDLRDVRAQQRRDRRVGLATLVQEIRQLLRGVSARRPRPRRRCPDRAGRW